MKKVILELDIKNDSNLDNIEEKLLDAAKAKMPALRREAEIERKLSQLHKLTGEMMGIEFRSMDELIERILPYSKTLVRKTKAANSRGRKPRTRITSELIAKIKEMSQIKLKAEIARDLELSYVVVCNAIKGLYDEKLARKQKTLKV